MAETTKWHDPDTGAPTHLLEKIAEHRKHNGSSATDPLEYAAAELARLERENAALRGDLSSLVTDSALAEEHRRLRRAVDDLVAARVERDEAEGALKKETDAKVAVFEAAKFHQQRAKDAEALVIELKQMLEDLVGFHFLAHFRGDGWTLHWAAHEGDWFDRVMSSVKEKQPLEGWPTSLDLYRAVHAALLAGGHLKNPERRTP